MDLQLKDKVALITGGSMGIGLAVAEGFAREGVHLILSAREEDRLKEAVKKIQLKYQVKVMGHVSDMTKADDILALAAFAEKEFGGVDILINNAGQGTNETIAEASDEKWYYYWDLHVMAAMRLSRALLPSLKKRGGGVIINNASICAKQPLGHEPIYNTTKAALAMFSKCLSNELIMDNIRVNTINPGLILTEAWQKHGEAEGMKKGVSAEDFLNNIAKENTPIGRFATKEELANFFLFLASPLASYCVGSTYYIDGGWLKVVD
ncbi:SDR family oxidoreductase [soil metagenome]